ncbi:hypothetical protein VSQ78_24830 [Nocardiopsis alba]|uniref:DUF4439 domain-containing protein n=1 Tax=Nocardiopsis alba TaxID=53437 RepID=A0ABV5E266_9ACTN
MTKPCVRDAGHSGYCQDGWGGTFQGVTPRPKASADSPVDETHDENEDTMGTETKTDPGTTRTAAALSAILAVPDAPQKAQRLKDADALFELLDTALRDGRDVPEGWHVETDAPVTAHAYVTSAYDELSEALRERGNARVARKALATAKAWWGALDSAMRVGSPLPEPWTR